MWGQADYGKGKLCVRRRDGVRVCQVYLKKSGFLAARQRARQWKALRARGVRFAIFPAELREEASRYGIRPLSVAPLRRALLGQLVGRGTCVSLRADYVDGDVERAALLLAKRYRYVALDVGRGEEALSELLYRRFGVARGAGYGAEMTVTFRDEQPGAATLCLGQRCGDLQRVAWSVEGREGEELPEEYLCALFLAGELKKEALCVKSLVSNA